MICRYVYINSCFFFKKRELEEKLAWETERRKEKERELEMSKVQYEKERGEIEERHKRELEEMREMYKGQDREKAEKFFMKILMPAIVSNITVSKTETKRAFRRQLEAKNREMTKLREELEEVMEENKPLACWRSCFRQRADDPMKEVVITSFRRGHGENQGEDKTYAHV